MEKYPRAVKGYYSAYLEEGENRKRVGGLLLARPLSWQQGALTRVEKTLPSLPPADFLGTGFPPQEARGQEGSILLLPCWQIRALLLAPRRRRRTMMLQMGTVERN